MKNKALDFVKWQVGYAEGFKWLSDETDEANEIILFKLPNDSECWLEGDDYKIEYPLLLQRAIEGINNISEYSICYTHPFYEIYYSPDNDLNTVLEIKITDFKSIDQAKEEALKYIYDKEQA